MYVSLCVQGSFQVLVEVYDTDISTSDDFIDVIFGAPFDMSVGDSITRTYSGRRAEITLALEVNCSNYYYGPNCDTFCEEEDSDLNGHYTCNPESGEKECRQGYTDSSTNCTRGMYIIIMHGEDEMTDPIVWIISCIRSYL